MDQIFSPQCQNVCFSIQEILATNARLHLEMQANTLSAMTRRY